MLSSLEHACRCAVVNLTWPPLYIFSSIGFPIRLAVTHRYFNAV